MVDCLGRRVAVVVAICRIAVVVLVAHSRHHTLSSLPPLPAGIVILKIAQARHDGLTHESKRKKMRDPASGSELRLCAYA